MQKRIVSLLLVLVMLVSLFPAPVRATETGSNVDSGMTVEGTNGFGNLLSAELQAEYEEETQDTGNYSVLGLEITGNTATVEYASMEEAVLVVALYSEDGMQLLTSGKTTVDPAEDIATVTIEGNMPEYFQASAYLVDTYDFSPLCASYDTPMYTREMQELLASTVEDYDADRVLQLDEDKTTNFAVYAEDTILIEEQPGVNTVASVNDETSTYVIENADESITSLREGDIFAYPYGDNEILIVKVASISVSGTTVTITGEEMEMEEAFSYVKIEGEGTTADAEVDESLADEGVTYLGKSNAAAKARASDEFTGGTEIETELEVFNVGAKLTGNVKLFVEVTVSYYITASYQHMELCIDIGVSSSIKLTGKLLKEIALPGIKIPIILGAVSAEFTPKFVIETTGAMEISYSSESTLNIYITHTKEGWRFGGGCTNERPVWDLEISAKVFVGLKLGPTVKLGPGGTLAEVSVEAAYGFEASSSGSMQDLIADESIHPCKDCYAGQIDKKVELEIEVKFLKMERLSEKATILEFKDKICDFYYCMLHDKFDFTTCPYIRYKVTVELLDAAGTPLSGVTVNANAETAVTNKEGVAEFYLPVDIYVFQATMGEETVKQTVRITDSQKVSLQLGKEYPNHTGGGTAWSPVESTIIDGGKIIASGTCGDNITWTLNQGGVLQLTGSGPMDDWVWEADNPVHAPWANYKNIRYVEITDGITSIGDEAFFAHDKLISVTIPHSVTSVGDEAFFFCHSLTSVSIPDSVTSIGDSAFSGCNSLTDLNIPDSVISIGDGAFYGCISLTNVTLPNSVTSIGDAVFYECTGLVSVTIPDSVTSIGEGAFSECTGLASVTIPDSVTSIGEGAFFGCTGLVSVTIPDSVIFIGKRAFSYCLSLTGIHVERDNPSYFSNNHGVLFNKNQTELLQVPNTIKGKYTIPDSVTSIGDHAFDFCSNLTSVTIPDSVTSIGECAFNHCASLANAKIPNSVTSIGDSAFFYCTSLTDVAIPDGVSSIGDYTFARCSSLTSVTIPDSVTFIDVWAFDFCSNLTDVYYSGTEEQWNSNSTLSSNDDLNSATIYFNSTGPAATTLLASASDADMIPEKTVTEETPTLDAIFGGEYGTEELEDYTLKTASFTGLVPNEEYLLLALAKLDVDDPLAVDNLLYIDQAAAGSDGKLTFEYIQRVNAEISYVMACGPSNKNLNNATITFPDMIVSGELQTVDPVVVYDGKTLTEGVDYILLGDVSFTEAGSYTCFIRGIHQYTGLVECSYRVTEYIPMENPFEDVFEADYYYDPVLWAVNEGITNGMDATHFAPAGTCTRSQIVTFLWRANGSPASGGTNPFTDVPADAWYTDAVLWAVEEGITTGTSATTFSPDAGCTRGQVATFLWRSQGQPSVNGENIFTDIAPGAYYYNAVLWAVANGITNGMGEGLFAPDATCTRGQIVTFLYRAMAD